MFTGLVKDIGVVDELRRTSGGARLVVSLGRLADASAAGDSISVSGACLTVAELTGERASSRASFDIVKETLSRTTLGDLRAGSRVNLEAALRASDALGGHFVTGHVDGVATLRSRKPVGEGAECTFAAERDLLADVVTKGSVAVDGVSLTVAALEEGAFRVALVPHTLRETTLGELAPGSRVNIETDMLVKAVRRIIQGARVGGGLSERFLRDHGFA